MRRLAFRAFTIAHAIVACSAAGGAPPRRLGENIDPLATDFSQVPEKWHVAPQ